jgi:hypothetical protein
VVPVDPEHLEPASTPVPVAAGPNLADRVEDGSTALELWLMFSQRELLQVDRQELLRVLKGPYISRLPQHLDDV